MLLLHLLLRPKRRKRGRCYGGTQLTSPSLLSSVSKPKPKRPSPSYPERTRSRIRRPQKSPTTQAEFRGGGGGKARGHVNEWRRRPKWTIACNTGAASEMRVLSSYRQPDIWILHSEKKELGPGSSVVCRVDGGLSGRGRRRRKMMMKKISWTGGRTDGRWQIRSNKVSQAWQ